MTNSATPEFNEVEHLQSSIRRWLNREVRDYFSDISIDNDWSPDLTIPRQSLAMACLHKDSDSLITTHLRVHFFEKIKNHSNNGVVIGIPWSSFSEERKIQPQIILHFKEDSNDVDPDYAPVTGRIGFRIMNETEQSMTETKLNAYANRIKQSFGNNGNGYIWRKGKKMFSYSDWSRGYQLQLLVRNEADGRDITNRVLDIQNHAPDWKYANFTENQEEMDRYPTIPPSKLVLGKSRRTKRRRPIASVRFQYAFFYSETLPNPIALYDRSYQHPNALQRSY